jgi:hypothetical protein
MAVLETVAEPLSRTPSVFPRGYGLSGLLLRFVLEQEPTLGRYGPCENAIGSICCLHLWLLSLLRVAYGNYLTPRLGVCQLRSGNFFPDSQMPATTAPAVV